MPSNGAVLVGKNHKLYYDADGDIASPTWVEVTICQSVTANQEWDVTDIRERGTAPVLAAVSHYNIPIEITLTRRPASTIYAAFKTAAVTGSKIGLAVMNGTVSTVGNKGWQGEFLITSNGDDQGPDSASATFTARLDAEYTTAPAFVTVSS